MSKNNKGFITIELIVVSVFILAIFAIIFANTNLAFQAYEKKEYYDDIDTKYTGYWIKRYINSSWETKTKEAALEGVDKADEIVYQFKCTDLMDTEIQNECNILFQSLEIKNVYITKYSLKTFKEYTRREDTADEGRLTNYNLQIVTNTASPENNNPNLIYMSTGMYDYIKQSPDYINNSDSQTIRYRLFIELESTYTDNTQNTPVIKTYNKYGTMELSI